MRFASGALLSKGFLVNWSHCMEPNTMFIEGIDGEGIAETVRWALMNGPLGRIRERLSRRLAII